MKNQNIAPNDGYVLSSLNIDGEPVSAEGSYTFTNVVSNHTISATFTPISYAIIATEGDVTPTNNFNVMTNLISNSNFETGDNWSGAVIDSSEKYFGNSSLKLSGTTVASIPINKPIIGHKYYGREYVKASSTVGAADSRFEIYGGDGAGLNWIFGVNNDATTSWQMISNIVNIDSLAAENYNIRTFVVNASGTVWVDGMMLIDLTATFGAGQEPSLDWCNANIPYFESNSYIQMYTIESSPIVLPTPTKTGCAFTGWTGSNGNTPSMTVTIPTGSTGDKVYTANWVVTNSAPGVPTVSVTSKTTSSFTVSAVATDVDGDNLVYNLYVKQTSGSTFSLKATSASTASGTAVSFSVTGLGEYTEHSYYVTATDGSQISTSSTGSVTTYCSGTGTTCTQGTRCYPPNCSNCSGIGYTCTLKFHSSMAYPSYGGNCPNGHTNGCNIDYYVCTDSDCSTEVQIYVCTTCESEMGRTDDYSSYHKCRSCSGTGKTSCTHGYTSSHYICSTHGNVSAVSHSCCVSV